MMSLPGFSAQNVLFYPLAGLNQIYSSLIAGSGNIRVGLFALKTALWSAPTDQAACATLQHCPPETILNIMTRLQAHDQAAFLETCSEIRNHFTPEQRKWIAFEKQCNALIDKKWQAGELSQPEKERLDQAYEQVLTKLLDPQTGNHDLQRIAALAENFSKALPRATMELILVHVLSRQPGNRQAQWERLAQHHLALCVSLSGLVSAETLAWHRVYIRETLLARLGERTEAGRFLQSMGFGWTKDNSALHYAVGNRFPQVAEALLKANPDSVDLVSEYATSPLGRGTPLMRAVYERNVVTVRLLLSYNARADWRNTRGETPLMRICSQTLDIEEARQIIVALLEHGADITLRNEYGRTVLMLACQQGHLGIIQLLLQHGADVVARDNEGRNALMHLSSATGARKQRYSRQIAEALLNAGEDDINLQDNRGDTALILASRAGNTELVRLLLQRGADFTIKNDRGDDVFRLARLMGREDMINLLESYFIL